MPGGRPPYYDNVEDLQKGIEDFFDKEKEHPTVTGLAIHLGFTTRQALINYEEKPEFVDTIKKAKLFIEQSYEKGLLKGKNPIGYIFALKNFGWSDRQEIKHEGLPEGPMRLEIVEPDED